MHHWRKASYSSTTQGACVEVADLAVASGQVGIRDSKNPDGGHLALSVEHFGALLHSVKRDRLNL